MRVLIFTIALWLVPGCALMSTRHPAKIRYFTIEPASAPAQRFEATDELELRLARVEAAASIQDRIAFRDETSEVGYYGNLRWAEPPEAYLRRGLERALFQQRGVREVVTGLGPSLEIELEAFEEVTAPAHVARVVVTWRLREGGTVLRQRTLTVQHAILSDDLDRVANADAVATAITVALGQVVADVAVGVVAELEVERGSAVEDEAVSVSVH